MSVNKRPGSVRSGGSSTATASASKKSVQAAEQDRPDVAAARTAWADNQPKLDPDRLIFIDETGTSTKMARLRHGTRLIRNAALARVAFEQFQVSRLRLRASCHSAAST